MSPFIHVLILNWRSPEMTLRAMEATLAEMEGLDGFVTLLDNDSQDGSFERLLTATFDLPRVRVVQTGHNGGFGAGNNHGILTPLPSRPKVDYWYIQNSDSFPKPGAIRTLVKYLEAQPRVGIAGSQLVDEEGVPQQTQFRFPSILSELEGAARTGPISRLLSRHAVPFPLLREDQPVDWLAGASMLIRASLLESIGLFDERFFLYFEETDLCRRARLAGFETHFVKASVVTHGGSVSTGMQEWTRVPEYWFDSRLHYFAKNHGPLYAAGATAAHVAGGLIHRLRCLVTGKAPADPPGFLRHLIRHDLSALLPAAARERRNAKNVPAHR
ncbi:glycosyltransferase family 2 protein [Pseudoroseicyclus tamaricis]|uniref:Glycosyltransferase family 2 protein n=1 Tax=Pseudoroseicyclus tamaricis TaxID=2705421 RepID=A0A6B2JEV8_9RHOB|nr:glycosyltransferase family 2 protein [Pseudoroseicyclus tamaricis]NDU99470.1 glycosyltransferase family 2 protein [Pseudoroseicyclus tamaricis]